MRKITPCLWYDGNAEEAVNFYLSIFKNSKIKFTTYYGEGMPMPEGTFQAGVFKIGDQEFLLLNGGPYYKLNPSISLMIYCDTQEEIDYFWDRLSEGGEILECGWLTDKFGLTWQVTPTVIEKMMAGDKKKYQSMMNALMQMKKLDIKVLQDAYDKG